MHSIQTDYVDVVEGCQKFNIMVVVLTLVTVPWPFGRWIIPNGSSWRTVTRRKTST